MQLEILKQSLAAIPQAAYPHHSRIHPLRSFHFPEAACYVKREDELGFGVSGSKIRKYRSLIPFLLNQHLEEVVVIGSAFSNHVLSITQLLIENKIRPTLFLRGYPECKRVGNCLLTSLLVPPETIHWISKNEWKRVGDLAGDYAKQRLHPTFVLAEGGFSPHALPGALTLPIDLHENEHELDVAFDHIFIEAGTGFMASSLILGLTWLQHPATVHVILLAEDQAAFLSHLTRCQQIFQELLKVSFPFPTQFETYLPQLTRGFGKTNRLIFEKIKQIGQEEGFLTDPIYSAKLFIEGGHLISEKTLRGIPQPASNLDLGPRESSRSCTIANRSILVIWTDLRSYNRGALARSKFQV